MIPSEQTSGDEFTLLSQEVGQPGFLPETAPLRILCVEDHPADFRLIELSLEDAALPGGPPLIQWVTTLSDALSALRAAAPPDPDEPGNTGESCAGFDVALLDLSLPDSFGSNTYIGLRNTSPWLPVIILSGDTDQDLAARLVKTGAQDYLLKDRLDGDRLGRSILYAIERKRAQARVFRINRELQTTTEHLKSVQMQLIQAEKLDSMGRLAAGVAHEVKNPLAVLLMGINYFEQNLGQHGATGPLVIEQMKDAISRADRIVRGMLDFSRANDFVLATVPINETVQRAVRMVQHEAVRARVFLRLDLAEPSPLVRADTGKMEQVLINLLTNAIHATTQGGDVHVRTRLASIESINRDEGRREVDLLRAGDEVALVEIRDHGTGIPAELMNRIFEPFFTTKPTGVGCGLGLSVAKSIVEMHRGRLQVQNVDPPGLRVRIFLKTDHLNRGETGAASESSVSPREEARQTANTSPDI